MSEVWQQVQANPNTVHWATVFTRSSHVLLRQRKQNRTTLSVMLHVHSMVRDEVILFTTQSLATWSSEPLNLRRLKMFKKCTCIREQYCQANMHKGTLSAASTKYPLNCHPNKKTISLRYTDTARMYTGLWLLEMNNILKCQPISNNCPTYM